MQKKKFRIVPFFASSPKDKVHYPNDYVQYHPYCVSFVLFIKLREKNNKVLTAELISLTPFNFLCWVVINLHSYFSYVRLHRMLFSKLTINSRMLRQFLAMVRRRPRYEEYLL